MKTFSTIKSQDYNVDEMYVSAPMSWQLISSSIGITVVSTDDLAGALTIETATNDVTNFTESDAPRINENSGTYEYVLYRSIKHLFYSSASLWSIPSVPQLPDNSYVLSIGQNFYGNRIKPGSFELTANIANKIILDDGVGNLYYSSGSTTSYIGNIFYDMGIAVIKHDTGSAVTSISSAGLKIINGTNINVDYSSDVKLYRHEIKVTLQPADFNFSAFNPSILSTYTATTGSVTQSFNQMNIKPSSGSSTWNLYNLMGAGVIKPYVTTIGLYNDKYELLAVAKTSEPIQRTFDVNQIFIVRFDT
jgi:hypothetical protein